MLNTSIVNYKSVVEEGRLDPEYYRPDFLENAVKINSKTHTLLGNKELTKLVSDGDHGNPEYSDTGVPYLKVDQLGLVDLDLSNSQLVTESYALKQGKKNYVKNGDVLVSMKGTIGKVNVVVKNVNAILNRDIARIVLTDKLNPYFLYVYLSSKPLQTMFQQQGSGGLQKGLYVQAVKKVPIINTSDKFQKVIEGIVIKCNNTKVLSENALHDINNSLLEDLGFDSFNPSIVNYSSRTYQSYLNSSRLDSEYWLPKYDEIEKKIKSYKDGYDNFDKLIKISAETIKIEADEKYRYAELANVNASVGLIEEPSELNGSELPSRAKMKLRKNDVVLPSVEGSADNLAIITEDISNFVGSTGFYVLREDYFLPEVMFVLFRIPYINALFKRQAQGTILTAVPRSSLSRVILPKIAKSYQKQIALQVQDAHRLYKSSKKFLETAKRAIEIFITENEEAALTYIGHNSY